MVICIVGPDGTGKTTLADRLIDELSADRPVLRFHHVYRLIRGSAASRRATGTPHAQRPYSALVSALKVAYLYVGHMARWILTLRPFVRRGGWLVVERGWWDMAVDPRRYRLSSGAFARRLGPFVPEPHLTFLLDAPADLVHARRAELPVDELDRQLTAWRALAAEDRRLVRLDASRPAESVEAAAIAAVRRLTASPESTPADRRWLDLPPVGRVRWTVPAAPRAHARGALLVHQPIRVRARAAWEIARILAGVGVLAAVPRSPRPEIPEEVETLTPPGGSVAIAHLSRPGRAVMLILDAAGRPAALAKIAADPPGRAKLAREAVALRRLGSRVKPPLFAPEVLAEADGIIVLEAADWQPRLRPWHLAPELAAAIGAFHRTAHGGTGDGPIHGDFAPWNILQVRGGWFLVDWEDARPSGPAFWDPLHFMIQGLSLLGRPHQSEILAAVHGRGPFAAALGAYAEASDLPFSEAEEALRCYLVRSQTDPGPDRSSAGQWIAVRRQLLQQLAPLQ